MTLSLIESEPLYNSTDPYDFPYLPSRLVCVHFIRVAKRSQTILTVPSLTHLGIGSPWKLWLCQNGLHSTSSARFSYSSPTTSLNILTSPIWHLFSVIALQIGRRFALGSQVDEQEVRDFIPSF